MHSLLKRKKIISSQYHQAQLNLQSITLRTNQTPIKMILKNKKNNFHHFLHFINQKEALSNKSQIKLNNKINAKIRLQKQSFSQLMVTTKTSDFQKLKNISSHFAINDNAIERGMKGRKLTHRSTCKSSFTSSHQSQQVLKTSKQIAEYSCSDKKYYLNLDLNRSTKLTKENFKQKKWHSEHKQLQRQHFQQKFQKQAFINRNKQNTNFNVIGRRPLWKNFQSFSPTLRNSKQKY